MTNQAAEDGVVVDDDDDGTVRRRRIARAALQALGWWIAFYIGLAHLFVVWKWQTPPTDRMSSATSNNSNSSIAELQQQFKELTELTNKLQTKLQQSQQRNENLQKQIQQWEQMLLQINAENQKSNVVGSDSHPISLEKTEYVRRLFRRVNVLRDEGSSSSASTVALHTNSSPLDEIFARAINEIEHCITNKDWSAIQYILVNETLPIQRDAIHVMGGNNCRQQLQIITPPTTVNATLLNREFEQSQQRVYDTFSSQRQTSIPVSFPETVQSIQEYISTIVSQAVKNASAVRRRENEVEDSISISDVECDYTEDQLIAWLDAGLDAIRNKRNLRTAILNVLQSDDIDTSTLILDADLPPSKSDRDATPSNTAATSPMTATGTTMNLRQILDTPTLHESSIIIDWILNFISGNHDGLDDLLDKYVYANVPNDKAVGRTAMEHLLQLAGYIDIPIPS